MAGPLKKFLLFFAASLSYKGALFVVQTLMNCSNELYSEDLTMAVNFKFNITYTERVRKKRSISNNYMLINLIPSLARLA